MKPFEPTMLSVGHPHPRKGLEKGMEGQLFEYHETRQPNLTVLYSNPKAIEVNEFQSGSRFEARIFTFADALFLLFKFGALPWFDCPYNGSLVSKEDQWSSGEFEEGYGSALNVCLVDSDTLIVKALRSIGLGTEFSRELERLIQKQNENPVSRQEHQIQVARAYSSYTPEQIAEDAIPARYRL